MQILKSSLIDRLVLEQHIIRIWATHTLFLVAAGLLMAAYWTQSMVGDVYQLHAGISEIFGIANPMQSSDAYQFLHKAWPTGISHYRSPRTPLETFLIGNPIVLVSQKNQDSCSDPISLRIRVMCNTTLQCEAEDTSTTVHLEGDELQNTAAVEAIAYLYTPFLALFTSVRVSLSHVGERAVSVIQSYREPLDVVDRLKFMALMLVAFQVMIDLQVLISSKYNLSTLTRSRIWTAAYSGFDNLSSILTSSFIFVSLVVEFTARYLDDTPSLTDAFVSFASSTASDSMYHYDTITSRLAFWSMLHVFQVVSVIVILGRISIFMGSHPRLAILIATMKTGASEILGFFTILVLIYVLFAVFGFVLFGENIEGFSQFRYATFQLFQMLLTHWPFDALMQVENKGGVYIFIFLFGLIMVLFVLNLFLAVILHAFDTCKLMLETEQRHANLFTDGWTILQGFWKGYRHRWPSRLEMARKLHGHTQTTMTTTDLESIYGSNGREIFQFYAPKCIAKSDIESTICAIEALIDEENAARAKMIHAQQVGLVKSQDKDLDDLLFQMERVYACFSHITREDSRPPRRAISVPKKRSATASLPRRRDQTPSSTSRKVSHFPEKSSHAEGHPSIIHMVGRVSD